MKQTSIIVVGPLPPPVHGASRVTESVLHAVQARLEGRSAIGVAAVSTASRSSAGRLRYHVGRVVSHLHAAGKVAAARLRGPTVVYLGGAGGGGLWYQLGIVAAARASGARVVFHHHSYSYLDGGPRLVMRAIARIIGRAGAHVCLSPGMADAFRATYRSRGTVLTVSNANFIRSEPVVRRRSTTAFRLVHVSNLAKEKGSIRVVEAFERLREADVDITLTLVGVATDRVVQAQIELARSRHPDRLRCLGQASREGVDAALDDADLFVFPTTYRLEAQPMVLLEAMARGVPVLATSRGSISDLLPPDWLLVDDESLEGRIIEMIGSDWDRLSAIARDRFAASRGGSVDIVDFLVGRAGPCPLGPP